MNPLIILTTVEQEYLLGIIESAVQVRDLRQFFLWSQGQLQALLPHQLMVCMQFASDQSLQRLEAVHASVLDDAANKVCDPHGGLAVRLARHCTAEDALPCMIDTGNIAGPLTAFAPELTACGYRNMMLGGSGPLPGGATAFALFGLPDVPTARQAYFLSLLLPQLHLALARVATPASPATPAPRAAFAISARPLSARETEIMHWLRLGKRNDEIGVLLGLSALTVKNHLHRIYKLLGVRNRAEAVVRCTVLRLLADETGAYQGMH